MNLLEAQNAFALRLYDWSLQDFRRELHEGCPLLSLVGLNNRKVAGFVAWVETMSLTQHEALAKAMIRIAHENAAALRGETMSRQEAEQWNMEFYKQVTIREYSLPPLETSDRSHSSFKRVDPDQCLDILFSSLSPILGKASRNKSGVRTTRKIGDWKVVTEFTFIRRDEYLYFDYQFVRKDGKPVIGHDSPFPRSLFMFYGVYATLVVVPSEADSEPMAKVMAKLAEYFVAQADPLFAELGIND